jgi:hypothetical protein
MTELMERLARANPASADEGLSPEQQREADALLERILAEPPPAEARPRLRVPHLRRVPAAAAVLALAALGAVVAIDLLGSGEDGRGGIVDRAAAAVSQENVIYAVTVRHTISSRSLTPGLTAIPDERGFGRQWLWAGGRRSRFLAYDLKPDGSRGALQTEISFDGDRMEWFTADSNTITVGDLPGPDGPEQAEDTGYPGFTPFGDPAAQLRAHVDSGRLRVAGRTTVRGRTAYRLVSEARDLPREGIEDERVTYLVDARTYLPLEVRNRVIFTHTKLEPGGPGRELARARIEYLRYEPLPVTDENEAFLEMGEHPGARHMRG